MNLNLNFDIRFQKLNDEQKQAVTTIYGPVMVVAGPGSGKTELLSMRVANILRQTDVQANNILCLTFTDAATKNMQERLSKIIGVKAFSVGIFTFHSFCQYVLNQYQDYFQEYADFDLACDVRKFEVLTNNLNNLSLDKNLRVRDMQGNYVFLNDVQRIITALKKANLDPDTFDEILDNLDSEYEILNNELSQFFSRVGVIRSIKALPELQSLLESIKSHSGEVFDFLGFELQTALASCEEQESTKPFTAFKNKYFAKDKNNNVVFKDSLKLENITSLAGIYKNYVSFFSNNGFRDFDDLILDLNKKLKEHKLLRLNLQETFQFILVDEFQDTSDAQMQLINLLAKPVELDLDPNLLVVGDDDQSIYKFQGANIKNILSFLAEYENVETIILNKNYRSNQKIVDTFSTVVKNSESRLSEFYPSIQKDLVAANSSVKMGDIHLVECMDEESEMHFITSKIKELSKTIPLSEIAVLARGHKDLRNLATYLSNNGIDVSYESNLNVFDLDIINLLSKMIILLSHFTKPTIKRVYDLLPEVLSHPAFNIPTFEIWNFSREAYSHRKKWEDLDIDAEKFPNIAKSMMFFKQLSVTSLSVSFRVVLDYLIGSKQFETQENLFDVLILKSPINDYFLQGSDLETYQNLEGLKAFVSAVEQYYSTANFDINQVVNYIEFYQNAHLKLNFKLSLSSRDSVNLLTAHGSKGLEFNTVLIFNTTHHNWGKVKSRAKLKLPSFLRLEPESDNNDDLVRLFFVALSRARESLFVTYPKLDHKRKENLLLGFLTDVDVDKINYKIDLDERIDVLKTGFVEKVEQDFDSNFFLQPIVDKFVVSISAILSFVDIVNSTPQEFMKSYLLRYPRATSKQASYGNSIHAALNFITQHLKNNNKLPDLKLVFDRYKKELDKQPLTILEHTQYLEKGRVKLQNYLEWHSNSFSKYDLGEYNMNGANLYINEFKIAGSLDRVFFDFDKKQVSVIDYKTGKPFTEFGRGSDSTKLKSFKYKLQLTFYKYLLQNHPNYKAKYSFGSAYIHFLDAESLDESVLSYQPSENDMKFLLELIDAVLNKIKNLDFPNVDHYEKNYNGMRQFIDDLIAKRI